MIMGYLKRIIISLLLLFTFFFLIVSIVYATLIYKPENIVNISNKIFNHGYSIEFHEVDSDINFFSPQFIFNQITLRNPKGIKLFEAEQLGFGISLLNTLTSGYLNLTFMDVHDVNFFNESPSTSRRSFKANVKRLYIQSEQFIIDSKDVFIAGENGNFSIVNNYGVFNNIPFKDLKIFNRSDSNKIFYSSLFFLDENKIKEEGLINLDAFINNKINLEVHSKGYFDTKLNQLVNLNKYIFTESNLTTNSNYFINNIDSIIYNNLDKKFIGVFSSSLPDQDINGTISINDQIVILRSKLRFNMDELLNYGEFIKLEGYEEFESTLFINNGAASLNLETDLSNTRIISNINDLQKEKDKELKTSIKIKNLIQPSYLIENKNFRSYLGPNKNGYFLLGADFEDQIDSLDEESGFHIFLSLNQLQINNLLMDTEFSIESSINSINLMIKELNFFNNIYKDQSFKIDFTDNYTKAFFSGKDLNGLITIDTTGFIRVEVFDTKFEFKGIDIVGSEVPAGINNLKLRFVGKNIQTYDDIFQDIDFYLLRNESITTIDNIKIKSRNFNIGPYNEKDKAYISFNKGKDLYKIRGSYEIVNKNDLLDSFIDYDLNYISTDLNIQWISLEELKDIQGNINFLVKGFESKASLPDSTFLRALKVFNLNAVIENIGNDTNIGSKNLVINRAEGNLYIGENRALIKKPIKLETSEANMRWTGEVLKNSEGYLDELNLNLEMRLRVSENIPWYAAIFGGMPALAGGIVFENIFEDRLVDVTTFKFDVKGSVEEPIIERLD
tara:strand:+ start:1737 stop:4094 length:2358 start_codon:yes stop_codon:yes gene_type:complete